MGEIATDARFLHLRNELIQRFNRHLNRDQSTDDEAKDAQQARKR